MPTERPRPKYTTASKIKREYDISGATLRNWANDGKLDAIRLSGGKRLYNLSSLESILQIAETIEKQKEERKGVIYARVSSSHQKEDLQRQINDLQTSYPEYDVIQDIASGLNWQRKGFKRLLEQVYDRNVSNVVVSHKDRLCRFGFDLVESVFKEFGVKIMVQYSQYQGTENTPYNELAEDLLAVTNFFVAKNNRLRAARLRRERAEKSRVTVEDSRSNGGTEAEH